MNNIYNPKMIFGGLAMATLTYPIEDEIAYCEKQPSGDFPYRIVVHLKSKMLYLYRNNKLFKKYAVAIGKPSTPTPKGNYKIVNREPNPGGPFGVLWLGLSKPHYGIHGTNRPSQIGKAVSDGCIRMHNKDVLELAKYAKRCTEVKIVD